MAPYAGPSPEAQIERLRDPAVESQLPLSMGGPSGPTAQFGIIDGQWCLYRMRVDDGAFKAFCDQQQREGKPLFPEHRMRFIVPGTVLLRAPDRQGLLDALAGYDVALDRNYQVQLKSRSKLRGGLLGLFRRSSS